MAKKLWVFALLLLLAPAVASAGPISSLYVFGDSLSDQGNGFALTGGAFPPPPYAGNASNGPVAVQELASNLGINLAPAALGGTNYAVVGATTGPVAVPGLPGVTTQNIATLLYGVNALANTGMLNQVASFLSGGPVIDAASSLFFVWGGANDLFVDPSAQTAANAISNIATAIGALYQGGARQFLVPNLADLSLTPSGLQQDPLTRAGLQALSIGFDTGLASALTALSVLPDIKITQFNTFGLLTAVSANPGAFGFANATDPCLTGNLLLGNGTVCSTPNSHVFWDSVHPTTAAHHLLGDAFTAAVVPEPATLAMLGVGLALTRVRRRR